MEMFLSDIQANRWDEDSEARMLPKSFTRSGVSALASFWVSLWALLLHIQLSVLWYAACFVPGLWPFPNLLPLGNTPWVFGQQDRI